MIGADNQISASQNEMPTLEQSPYYTETFPLYWSIATFGFIVEFTACKDDFLAVFATQNFILYIFTMVLG